MAPVIIAKGLHKAYAGFAPVLRGVDIEVQAGELVAIMGPSGCGKSTMLHVLGMLHAPDKGELTILGTDVLTLKREQVAAFRRGNMGFVMQASNLFDHSTVFENVEFPLIYERVPPQERWERVIRALDLVRLSSRVHYRSNRLSGGEQQRVAIARAMVNNPRILLADEPTGALDAHTSRLIMENFRNLCHKGGVALVMVTHDPKMADYCDTIYTLEEGLLFCRKHELVQMPQEKDVSLLAPPVPVVKGALVAESFPEPSGRYLIEEARLLYSNGLLSRIHAIRGSSFLGNPEGYALPLAVRRLALFEHLTLFCGLFSGRYWKLRSMLPSGKSGQTRALLAGMRLAAWIREEGIRFLYASGAHAPATAVWAAARLTGLPFAFDARAADLRRPSRDLAVKAAHAVFIRCDTEATRNHLKDFLPEVPDEKLLLARDPLTLCPSEDAEPPQTVLEGDKKDEQNAFLQMAAVGTLDEHKGFDVIIKAIASLGGTVPLLLRIAGQGKCRSRLARLVRRLGVEEKISFLGQLPFENMADLYSRADVFIAAGCTPDDASSNGFPTALAEAMAFGLPVIASNLPEHCEIVRDRENGLVVHQNDPQALAEAIRELYGDKILRLSLGRAAQKSIHKALDGDDAWRCLGQRIARSVD
ncbi:MAG: ATP-binding cassette domain-containing protein [Desulfovibrio sp.]|nr:ATP-binding cassette domain-containing protein [Desulfovibrio sp.]